MKYVVEIKKVMSKKIIVDGNSEDEVINSTYEKYHNGDIDISPDDYDGATVSIVEDLTNDIRKVYDFCFREYGSCLFDEEPLTKIPIAYTTITDYEIPIQVELNLLTKEITRYIDLFVFDTNKINIDWDLDFTWLISVDREDLFEFCKEKGIFEDYVKGE